MIDLFALADRRAGADGPPLPGQPKPIRPCLAKRKAMTEARWSFIARYSGHRTPEWIGRRLGMSPEAVVRFMWRYGCAPTTRDDLLSPLEVGEILGYTQQWVVRLIKRGRLRGWRNPGGRWWLIPRDAVDRYLSERNLPRAKRPAWFDEPSGWPRAVRRRH